PVRCAIYTRRSVDQNDDLSSCQIQLDLCRAFVQSQKGLGWLLLDWRFDDDGYSGATLDRPALQGLLKLIRCGAVDRVVVQRLDRLSRSLRDFVFLAQEFRANNVELNVVAARGRRTHARRGCPRQFDVECAGLVRGVREGDDGHKNCGGAGVLEIEGPADCW